MVVPRVEDFDARRFVGEQEAEADRSVDTLHGDRRKGHGDLELDHRVQRSMSARC